MPYQAFLSYSHAVDGRLAPALQSALHRFAKPWYQLRALRVFRDTTSLAANPALWPSIEQALAESEYFLLLASPEAARSAWVEREVAWWLDHRAVDRLLIVLTGGELVWDAAAGDWDRTRTSALPPGMHGRFAHEPLHVDLRWARTTDALSLRHSQFRAAVLDLAATLHDRPKDELDGEDVRLHRGARRLAAAAVCLLVALTVAAGAAAWVAHRQAQVAERRRQEADRERRIALARQLAAEAEVARTQHPTLLPRSVLLAIEATRRLQALGLRSAEADQTLRQGLALLPARSDTLPHADVIAAAVDPDGNRAATAARNGSVRIWDLPARREVSRFASDGELLAAAFSPDLTWLAIVVEGDRAAVQVRDVASGTLRFRLAAGGWVDTLAFSPDARALAAGGLDGVVRVTALTDGREILHAAHRSVVNAIAWSADGRRLATATGSLTDRMLGRPPQDDAAHVWDVASGRRVARLPHDHVVEAVALAPDGKLVASGSLDRLARVWDVATRREMARMAHEDGVAQVVFSPDGRRVASASRPYLVGWQQQTVRLWEIGGREIGRVAHGGGVRALVFSPDGTYLAAAGSDHTARLLDTGGREVARLVLGSPVETVAFTPDGHRFVAAGGEVRLATVAPGLEATALSDQHVVVALAVAPVGSRLATTGNTTTASLWDTRRAQDGPRALAHESYVVGVTFAPDGALLATAGHDRTARLWDAATGAPRGRLAHDAEVLHVTFAPDGRRVATASADGTARVWDVASGRQEARLEHGERVTAGQFSPDGRMLATGAASGAVRIWELASGRERARFALGVEPNRLAYDREGRHLVAAGFGRVAIVYDAAAGREVARLPHDREVLAVAYSPDGRLLATAAVDGAVRLWEPDGSRERGRLRHEDSVNALAFAPDGRSLATGSADRTARVWDLESRREVARLEHATTVNAVAFTSDGRRVVTASGDPLSPPHAVRVWLLEPDDLIAEACARLDGNLSREEWQRHLGDTPYRKSCRELPMHPTTLAAMLERAADAAGHGPRPRADRLYRLLGREAAAGADGQLANGVCWYGSLDGRPADVLPACERAVALLPDQGEVRDSRGLARALTGDRPGAIDDFSAFVAWARQDTARAPHAAVREAWIAALRAGRDPFDAATLHALRDSGG